MLGLTRCEWSGTNFGQHSSNGLQADHYAVLDPSVVRRSTWIEIVVRSMKPKQAGDERYDASVSGI